MADEVKDVPEKNSDAPKKTVTKKQPAKPPIAPPEPVKPDAPPEPVKPEKVDIKFFFPKSAKKSFRTSKFQVKAENHVFVLAKSAPKYDEILEFLRGHRENGANGGRSFVELTQDAESTSRGELIDKLIAMEIPQLRKVCGGEIELELITSKGQLIDIYLRQQEV
jgi:hypothetical protein